MSYLVESADKSEIIGNRSFDNLEDATIFKFQIEQNYGFKMVVIDNDGYLVPMSELLPIIESVIDQTYAKLRFLGWAKEKGQQDQKDQRSYEQKLLANFDAIMR